MRKLASPSTQANLVACSRAKKHPTALVYPSSSFSGSSTGIYRRIHGLVLEDCFFNRQAATIYAAKRKAASQARAPSTAAKRPRPNNIHQDDKAAPSHKIQIRKPVNDLLRCSSQIPPIWGTKRARRSALLGGDDLLLLRSSQIPPIWGAKRARSALIRGSNWRDWTDLGEGPAGLIADRLLASDVADYVSFRAVCRPWRLCCTDPRAHGILDRRFHPRQWIMLRGATEVSQPPLRRSFLNVSTGYSRQIRLPELRGHRVYGPTSEGLLVLVDMATFEVRLLNPFTRQAVRLPPATTLIDDDESDLEVILASLSVSGAGLADDTTFAVHFHMVRTLAVIKPGDAHWTVVHRGTLLFPAMSFAGRFYCTTDRAVMVVETSADRPPQLAVAADRIRPSGRKSMDTVHLVDNGGELMLVDRECLLINNDIIKYNVHRVDLDTGKMLPVRGLGGRAVFIGMQLSLSVSPLVFPSISADTIYLGFGVRMLDNTPLHLMDGDSNPRKWKRCIKYEDTRLCGPSGLDYYLSCYVKGYGDTKY